jgi:CheY-like chemotaxis protein
MEAMMDRKRILVVDDLLSTAQLIQKIFEIAGYATEVALGGEEALEKASTQPFDCILLDVMMPDMDGFEVCSRLKQSHFTASIPVVFVTALLDEASRRKGFNMGGEAFITKPFRFEDLFHTVDELIKQTSFIPKEPFEMIGFVREPVQVPNT